MMPIQKLLNRIRWDRDFARAFFELGYADHVERKILRIPVGEVRFEEGSHFSFQMVDAGGEIVTIPFHRIRRVYRDGVLIWERGPVSGE
jgi:uncharacterized protein (UPF0248 family)